MRRGFAISARVDRQCRPEPCKTSCSVQAERMGNQGTTAVQAKPAMEARLFKHRPKQRRPPATVGVDSAWANASSEIGRVAWCDRHSSRFSSTSAEHSARLGRWANRC
jgi:hypothetical protein